MNEGPKEFGDGTARAGIARARRDFVQWNEDKGPLGETRVGDLEGSFAQDKIAIKNDIEIERAGAVWDSVHAVAAEGLFGGENGTEELERRKRGFKRDHGVEEARLIGETDGLSGIKGRLRTDAADWGEARDSRGQSGVGRAGGAVEIGAEGDISERHVEYRLAESAGQQVSNRWLDEQRLIW